jgi:electron transfer flavoprotein alpha subunit
MSVLVFIQNFNGKLKKQNFELASFGSGIAKNLGCPLYGLVIGDISQEELAPIGNYGVQKIFHVQDEKLNKRINKAFTKIIEQLAAQISASVILFSDNNTGKALGPRLSVRLKAGFVPNVIDLPGSYHPMVLKRSVYSGKAYANVKVVTDIAVISLTINAFQMIENKVETSIEDYSVDLSVEDLAVHVKQSLQSEKAIALADADIVVSGGRGMKSADNWGKLEALAGSLNAALACSRPVADDGWRSADEHVGQTGKIIAPNLYIAVGISGAIQHVAGVSGSKKILAINTDAEAPIFKVADYGVVGEANDVLPKLTEAIQSFKSDK